MVLYPPHRNFIKNSMGNPVAYAPSKGGVITLTKYLAVCGRKGRACQLCLSTQGSNDHEEEFKNFRNSRQ